MSFRNTFVVLLLFGALCKLTDAKSLGESRQTGGQHHKSKSNSGGSQNFKDDFDNINVQDLKRLVHKRASWLDGNTNPIGSQDWMSDISAPGAWGGDADSAFRLGDGGEGAFRVTTKRTPPIFNMGENPEMDGEKEEAFRKMQLYALLEAARKQDLPFDYYLNNYVKRNGLTGALGYDELMNQPRLLDRETREDGRRYLLWRKITG